MIIKLFRAFVWPAFFLLIEGGLQVSGFTNQPLAILLFVLAGITFVWAVLDTIINKNSVLENTRTQKLKLFIKIKEKQLKEMLDELDFGVARISNWKNQLIEGIKIAYHGNIENEDIVACLSFIESRYEGILFYENSMVLSDKKRDIEECLEQIRLISRFIFPYELSDKFNPDDLKAYETAC